MRWTAALVFLLLWPAAAGAASSSHVRALDRMMVQLARESARDSAAMRRLYRPHLELLALEKYGDLVGALATGGLAPLPPDPERFNLAPRLDGPHPIGEKDLQHQETYIAARPAALGALLAIASRVRSGPVEVTSLVRHSEYQDALKATNANASTSVPTHTMGVAFDIALVNTPLRTVDEIRRVLRDMRRAGDILFIGERRQLVFHVVPHPSRLGYFTELYERALGAQPASRATLASAAPPLRRARGPMRPSVVAEVVSVVPRDEQVRELWDAMSRSAPVQAVLASAVPASSASGVSLAAVVVRALLALAAALVAAGYRIRVQS